MTSSRKRIEKYGLNSQKLITQTEAKNLLNKNGIVINGYNKNCLFAHNKRESIKHFIVKALLFKILRDLGRNVGSEIEIKNGIVDIIDADNMIAYEIENHINKNCIIKKIKNYKAVKDIFFIDCKKVPINVGPAEKYLKGIVV